MNFPYTTLPGIPKDTKRPLVPAKFSYKEKTTLPILCLVDSGADYSYMTEDIAEFLGINLSKIKPVKSYGINGAGFVCYPAEVTIEIGGYKFVIPVHFSRELNPVFRCVLGQEGFFSKARIVFERYKWNLEIKFREDLM